MIQLNDMLPLSQRETYWTFYGEDHEGLPNDGRYVVFEYYCDNESCHCEKLTADIMQIGEDNEHIEKSLAVISYDWSSKKTRCYPTLDEGSPKTDTARYLLEVYKKFIHCDEYIARIKRHYAWVKQLALEQNSMATVNKDLPTLPKIGRNDPCHCGSGRKFKKCCLPSIK